MSDRTTNRRSTARTMFSDQGGIPFFLEIRACISSELRFIAPVIGRIVRLIEESRCAPGDEDIIEPALQEALNNAVVHGNRLDSGKQVRIRCQCEQVEGVFLIVADQGQGWSRRGVEPLVT